MGERALVDRVAVAILYGGTDSQLICLRNGNQQIGDVWISWDLESEDTHRWYRDRAEQMIRIFRDEQSHVEDPTVVDPRHPDWFWCVTCRTWHVR